jgi:hypothetical protein
MPIANQTIAQTANVKHIVGGNAQMIVIVGATNGVMLAADVAR